MNIFCCKCKSDVKCELITGDVAYNNRNDLKHLKFWQCPKCSNFVGCHKGKQDGIRNKPLGCIPTSELKNARQHIHRILDPLWNFTKKDGEYWYEQPKILSPRFKRHKIYAYLSDRIGKEYHTAEIRNIEDARKVYRILLDITNNINKYSKIIGGGYR